LGMLIVCESNSTKNLYTPLQTVRKTTYFRILETQTKCRSNHGAIARSFPKEEQHDNVLYY
jgi:hypothetical protein